MEPVINVLWDALPGIASAAVLFVCGYAFRKVKGFRGEHEALVKSLEKLETLGEQVGGLTNLQELQNAVLRELIGRELDREHERLVKQGYASLKEKEAYERMYKPYHAIFGNGTRTSSYEDVMGLNAYPS